METGATAPWQPIQSSPLECSRVFQGSSRRTGPHRTALAGLLDDECIAGVPGPGPSFTVGSQASLLYALCITVGSMLLARVLVLSLLVSCATRPEPKRSTQVHRAMPEGLKLAQHQDTLTGHCRQVPLPANCVPPPSGEEVVYGMPKPSPAVPKPTPAPQPAPTAQPAPVPTGTPWYHRVWPWAGVGVKDSEPLKDTAPAPEPSKNAAPTPDPNAMQAPAPSTDTPPKVTPPESKAPEVEAGKQKIPRWRQDCMDTYASCINQDWVQKWSCNDCLRFCIGQQVWPRKQCYPPWEK